MSLLTLVVLLISACSKDDVKPRERRLDLTAHPEVQEIANAENLFGFKLFKQLHAEQEEENIFISPLSIATALTMTVNGAQGPTLEGMQKALEINDLSLEELNAAYQVWLDILPKMDNDVQLSIANSIWYRNDYDIFQSFLDVNRKHFYSEVRPLDFNAAEAAKNTINSWVKEKTNGKIDAIVDEIKDNSVMFLINAIYFKGGWLKPFNPAYTGVEEFYPNEGQPVFVDMMSFRKDPFPYFETEQLQAVDLAYGDSLFAMTVLLPKAGFTVTDVINELSLIHWTNWAGDFVDQQITLKLPRFKIEYEKKLKAALTTLGMGLAFDKDHADFSNMGSGTLFIDQVTHKSFIEVDEKGAEGAAVTSVDIGTDSAVPVMTVNRPFVFMIRELTTNGILFIGKLMDPVNE